LELVVALTVYAGGVVTVVEVVVLDVEVVVVEDVVELVLDVVVLDVLVVVLDVEVVVVEDVVELVLVVELLLDVEVVEDELVDEPYVCPLKASTYVLMSVARWSPGEENSPTANPISIVDPTPSARKSYGEALVSLNGR
jgi:hypothetical protein